MHWVLGSMNIFFLYCWQKIPVVPAQGGAEVALGLTYKTCSSLELACAVRQPFVRTCCTAVAQEHDLCATPVRCNAKQTLSSHFMLHSSHPALHTSHLRFTLHTSPHLKSCEHFSPHLTSSHPISPHMLSRQVLLNCFHLIRSLINLFDSLEVFLNSSQLFCAPESSDCQREVPCTK